MIEYSIKQKEIKYFIHSFFLFTNSFHIIVSVVCLPLAIFFLMVGFLSDKEAFKFAFPLLIIEITMVCVMIKKYFHIKNVVCPKNQKYCDHGELKFSLMRENDLVINKCISNQVIRSFLREDIKKIKVNQKVIMIMTRSNAIHFFPNNDQIKSIIGI